MKTGFTLTELVLVAVLLVVLTGIALPRMGYDVMGKVQADSAAREFANRLRLAKTMAITNAGINGSGYKVVLTGPFASYRITNAATLETVKSPVDIPQGVTCSGNNEFHFTPLGRLQNGSTLTLQFTKAGDTKVVTVTPIGRITVQ